MKRLLLLMLVPLTLYPSVKSEEVSDAPPVVSYISIRASTELRALYLDEWGQARLLLECDLSQPLDLKLEREHFTRAAALLNSLEFHSIPPIPDYKYTEGTWTKTTCPHCAVYRVTLNEAGVHPNRHTVQFTDFYDASERRQHDIEVIRQIIDIVTAGANVGEFCNRTPCKERSK